MMGKLDFTPVVSSNIGGLAHDGADLHVQFKNGSHYVYASVPRDIYHSALAAESVGKFIDQNVKGKFSHSKRK
jgi:hypothetical protein